MSDNIQVVVRCRPRNAQETAAKSPAVVDLPSDVFSAAEPFVSVVQDPSPLATRTSPGKVFKVDQIYGPAAPQSLLFDNVALPLFSDFVSGLNVTILAYGQTGSGKTHTMCGAVEGDEAGIVPRTLARLFSSVDADCMVKISCVELYKEELHDLINDDLDLMPVKSKLRLLADSSKDSQAIIQNLSEVHIDSTAMGLNILNKCLNKRRTSATKMNSASSRSHTIFSIMLYRSVKTAAGPAEFAVSKMNLVDLAGSEDINKSGSVNERAREAGAINQSLLTLGKVISALSEGREPRHIPYRESKLTRLLQGSIGGKTKTALIATISPAKVNIQETLSTLNYASKAKNIKNLPQSPTESETILKKVLVSELSAQIARITRDLMASKDKEGGIKMSVQNYQDYNNNLLELQTSLKEKDTQITALTSSVEAKNNEIAALQQRVADMESASQLMQKRYDGSVAELASVQSDFSRLENDFSAQKQKVADIMRNSVADVIGLINDAAASVTSSTDGLSDSLFQTKTTFVSQLVRAQVSLTENIRELASSLGPGMETELAAILSQPINSSALAYLQQFNLDKELQSFKDTHSEFSHQIKSRLEADAYKTVMEEAARKWALESESVKRQLMSRIQSSVEAMFDENQTIIGEAVKSTASSLLAESRSGIQSAFENHIQSQNEVCEQIKDKAQAVQHRSVGLEKELQEKQMKSKTKILDAFKQKVDKGIENVTSSSVQENKVSISTIHCSLDAITDECKDTSAKLTDKLAGANENLQRFQDAIDGLGDKENMPEVRKMEQSELRSPTRFKVPAAKRRKPMSPLKDNGLTRIPQLNPYS